MQREMQKMTWKQVRDLVPDEITTVIFPVGTLEAHGATALGTDNYIPESIAHYMADKINDLIAPTVNYGITRSLYGYPGSITVSPDSFKAYIRDILDSFVDVGFEQVILLNGHGGNNEPLKEIAHTYFYDTDVKIAVIHWWEFCDEVIKEVYGQDGGHAALNETAMMQAIDESLVDASEYDTDMVYTYRPGADVYPVPGSILLYTKDEGYPDFDAAKAKEYQQKVFECVTDFAKFVLERWDMI